MSLFRKKALDALNSPEQLDQPMQLLRPGYWALLLSLLGFSVSLVLWSIFGRLPVRISGQGVLIRTDSLQRLQSETPGRVVALMGNVGDCVAQGTPLARIDSVQQDLDRSRAINQLQLLQNQDRSEDGLAGIRERELQQQIERVQGLVRSGAISKDDLSQRQQQLSSTRIELRARDNQRQQQIQEQRNLIRNLQESIRRTAVVVAPRSGCIVDRSVKVGEVIQPGTSLFELESSNTSNALQSLAFFAPGDGKRLKPGQRVQITPASTKAQRHGGIEGTILRVQPLPVTEEAVISRLGNPAWMKALGGKSDGPLIEVITSLRRNPRTISGYDWGGGAGPALRLSAGTPTSVRVVVEERRPISYVIPILRDLSGIY
ncbi:MAG: HlyD family efflux transporter periplasmic adaptor subunit [Cyanobacteria bacterium M_surface_9_m1_291]|nr:HlyD family efflux transporter periplasmic adaptor subunit [Cyanobacteria bacterium M_surface_9_m1_291]